MLEYLVPFSSSITRDGEGGKELRFNKFGRKKLATDKRRCHINSTFFAFADVALKKPALQSSLFAVGKDVKDDEGNPILIPGVGPELAVDGNMSTTPSLGSCSMTALEANAWWKVDLESEHIVTDINVVSSSGE